MSSVEEIEAAITRLPDAEFAQLRDWMLERDNAVWDKQIEADSESGQLDVLIAEVEQNIADNKTKPLDELLHDD